MRAFTLGTALALLAGAAPGTADAPRGLNLAMERHVCGVVAMYKQCMDRAEQMLADSRGGSDTLPGQPSALAATGPAQCAQILRQLETWQQACEATRPRDPAPTIDCGVFARRDFPPGTC